MKNTEYTFKQFTEGLSPLNILLRGLKLHIWYAKESKTYTFDKLGTFGRFILDHKNNQFIYSIRYAKDIYANTVKLNNLEDLKEALENIELDSISFYIGRSVNVGNIMKDSGSLD